jgi:Bacterial transcriptional activator domain
LLISKRRADISRIPAPKPLYQPDINRLDGCGVRADGGLMEVRVLGALTLDEDRIPLAPRDRVVLGALTVRLGASLSVESLAEALWGADLPASWSKVIPGCIMRLRRLIAPAQIETTPFGYRLTAEHIEVDADQFERLVSRGTQQLKLGEPERAAHSFSEALALWRGEAYVEVIDWGPAQIASGRLEEIRPGPRSCFSMHGCKPARFRRSPPWRAPASPKLRCASGAGSC